MVYFISNIQRSTTKQENNVMFALEEFVVRRWKMYWAKSIYVITILIIDQIIHFVSNIQRSTIKRKDVMFALEKFVVGRWETLKRL